MKRPWKGGGGLLGFWVDLGDELGEIGRLERAWFLRKKKGQCYGNQREKKEKFCWGIPSGFQLSLLDGKRGAQKERSARPFICCSRLDRELVEFEFHRCRPLQMRETRG